jgi:hypothetical protein
MRYKATCTCRAIFDKRYRITFFLFWKLVAAEESTMLTLSLSVLHQQPNPLHAAAATGDTRRVIALIGGGVSVSALDEDSWTPLAVASKQGHVEVVKALLAAGAPVAAPLTELDDEMTPLHIAAHQGRAGAAAALIEANASLEATAASDGATALHIAAAEGKGNVVRLLLAAGASGLVQTKAGETPLHLAQTRGHVAVARSLAAWEEEQREEAAFPSQLAWLRDHPKGALSREGASRLRASLGIDSSPQWMEDVGLQRHLLGSHLVRIVRPFPSALAEDLSREMYTLPEPVWFHDTRALRGFQFSHHNVYFSHRRLANHTPTYGHFCDWLQTHGRAWFERVAGGPGTVTCSLSWYRPGDYSLPHNDMEMRTRRFFAYVWHLSPPCVRETGMETGSWDETLGGDLIWLEPFHRFAPTSNTLYLFRVHRKSYHFVAPVFNHSSRDTRESSGGGEGRGTSVATGDTARCKRLAINGWFHLSRRAHTVRGPQQHRNAPRPSSASSGLEVSREAGEEVGDEAAESVDDGSRWTDGYARHRELLARLLSRGEEHAFVYAWPLDDAV